MPGAAILCARAAQRAGAGLVAVGCVDLLLAAVLPCAAPEAVLVDLSDVLELRGGVRTSARERLRQRAPHAVLLGPGLGADARTRSLVELVLDSFDVPLVLDADGLNVLAGEVQRLRQARARLVLTPHPGEAARLLGRAIPEDEAGRERAARELAECSGAIVCLKGRGTWVVEPEGGAWCNPSGNPGMATAGAGDVLAGILGAYLALVGVGADAWTAGDAARAAVYVHGLAGDLAAAALGERAVIASDLIRELPAAQRRFESGPGEET